MHLDRRSLVEAQCPIVVEVALLDAAVADRYLAEQGSCQTENDPAFDLRLDRVGVDDYAAIDRAYHMLYPHLSVRGNRHPRDLCHISAEHVLHSDPAAVALRQRCSPSRL